VLCGLETSRNCTIRDGDNRHHWRPRAPLARARLPRWWGPGGRTRRSVQLGRPFTNLPPRARFAWPCAAGTPRPGTLCPTYTRSASASVGTVVALTGHVSSAWCWPLQTSAIPTAWALANAPRVRLINISDSCAGARGPVPRPRQMLDGPRGFSAAQWGREAAGRRMRRHRAGRMRLLGCLEAHPLHYPSSCRGPCWRARVMIRCSR